MEEPMIPAAFVLLPMLVLDAIIVAMVVVFVHNHSVRRARPHM